MNNVEYFRKQLSDANDYPVRLLYFILKENENEENYLELKSMVVNDETEINIEESNLKFLDYSHPNNNEEGIIPVFQFEA